jgi:hypothetical protein
MVDPTLLSLCRPMLIGSVFAVQLLHAGWNKRQSFLSHGRGNAGHIERQRRQEVRLICTPIDL